MTRPRVHHWTRVQQTGAHTPLGNFTLDRVHTLHLYLLKNVVLSSADSLSNKDEVRRYWRTQQSGGCYSTGPDCFAIGFFFSMSSFVHSFPHYTFAEPFLWIQHSTKYSSCRGQLCSRIAWIWNQTNLGSTRTSSTCYVRRFWQVA